MQLLIKSAQFRQVRQLLLCLIVATNLETVHSSK